MKNLLTTIFTILSLSLGAQYQYSVVANSTLNLRSAPSISSNIVTCLQPFDLVIADLEYVDFIQKQLDATAIIGGRKGFWLRVSSGAEKGYVFSAYLIPYDYSAVIDTSLSIALLGRHHCSNQFRYNPVLDYYFVQKKPIRVQKVDLHFSTNYETKQFVTEDIQDRYTAIQLDIGDEYKEQQGLLLGWACNFSSADIIQVDYSNQQTLLDTTAAVVFEDKDKKYVLRP